MSLNARIGLNLREHRKRRAFTQERLAEAVDRSVDAISSIERGVMMPSLEMLELLARALDVPVAALLEGDDTHSASKAQMIAQLVAAAHSLTDRDLEIAVKQVLALAERR